MPMWPEAAIELPSDGTSSYIQAMLRGCGLWQHVATAVPACTPTCVHESCKEIWQHHLDAHAALGPLALGLPVAHNNGVVNIAGRQQTASAHPI
jgi:hypothetical protein